MNINNLTEQMNNAHINDEQLLFRPASYLGIPDSALDHVPRFLFRIVSPYSDGAADSKWMRSQAAYEKKSSSREDIFFRLDADKEQYVAGMLNVHLRWKPKHWYEDNLVSWTSSLLFALQYIYYRHLQRSDGSNLEEIRLFVVDTALFPRGTFMRDLDLIDAFAEFNDGYVYEDLSRLASLRRRGDYYFGEYLSQGSLKIEGNVKGLQASMERPPWANEVRDLRATIWTNNPSSRLAAKDMRERMVAPGEIIDNFDPAWRFPMAIYFAGLVGPQSEIQAPATNENAFFLYFKPYRLRSDITSEPSAFKVVAPDSMPELKRVEQIFHEICIYYMQASALAHLQMTESRIRDFQQKYHSLAEEDTLEAANKISILADGTHMIKAKLADIQTLCEQASRALGVEGQR